MVVEFGSPASFIEKLNILKEAGIYPKKVAIEAHSSGDEFWTDADPNPSIKLKISTLYKYIDFIKMAKQGGQLILGQCGSYLAIGTLIGNLRKEYKGRLNELEGLTIWCRNHTASFNGAVSASEARDEIVNYALSGSLSKYYKITMLKNGQYHEVEYLADGVKVLIDKKDFILSNKEIIVKYGTFNKLLEVEYGGNLDLMKKKNISKYNEYMKIQNDNPEVVAFFKNYAQRRLKDGVPY